MADPKDPSDLRKVEESTPISSVGRQSEPEALEPQGDNQGDNQGIALGLAALHRAKSMTLLQSSPTQSDVVSVLRLAGDVEGAEAVRRLSPLAWEAVIRANRANPKPPRRGRGGGFRR
jgi:hypothetical protein